MRKIMYPVIAIALMTTFVTGCGFFNRNDVSLAFSASEGASSSGYGVKSVTIGTGVVLDSFMLSIRNVEFKVDENDPDNPADVVFTGPYILDLLDSTGPLTQTIGDAEVPPGEYQEIRFKLHKTTDVPLSSPLYDRSIYLSGTIGTTSFEAWHDTSENLDVLKATGILVGEGPLDLEINFDVLMFLDQSAAGGVAITMSNATDVDGDGTIEINPASDDGGVNQGIADDLKDNIKLTADLLEL